MTSLSRSSGLTGPLQPRNVALGVFASAYVGLGSIAFHLAQALFQDTEAANTVVAVLAAPLAGLLWAAIRWTEDHL